ncbi:MAG: hypothetical protein AABW80_04445 [Nanoarchaeota archaeon]
MGNLKKRGQIQLSFGMIFSIILIIATVAVAFFFIKNFLNSSSCVQVNKFYDDLQKDIDKVWRAPQAEELFMINLPGGINAVCFGNLELAQQKGFVQEYGDLRKYQEDESNIYLYPGKKACDGELAVKELKHFDDSDFFCINLDADNKIKIIKESSKDSLVKIESE